MTTYPSLGAARTFEDLTIGEPILPVTTNLTLHRLVLEAAANRDFTNLHHDDQAAQSAGARGAFINNAFALGLWERAVRDFAGPGGVIHAVRGLRMSSFNVVGDELVTDGYVESTWVVDGVGFAAVAVQTTNRTLNQTTLGPGVLVLSLPRRGQPAQNITSHYATHAAIRTRPAARPVESSPLEPPWADVAALVGDNLLTVPAISGADRVERSVVRRLCEPLELASPVHHDLEAARRSGFDGIVAPVCGLGTTYVDPGSWHPGQPTQYPRAARDARLPRPAGIENGDQIRTLPLPEGSVAIVTEIGLELAATIYVGDQLSVRAVRLVDVAPKRTSIGTGAFLTFVNEVWSDDHLVGWVTKVQYQYRPHPEHSGGRPLTGNSERPTRGEEAP